MYSSGRRIRRPEILDTLSGAEAEASLRDLLRLNGWFGGYLIARRLLRNQPKPFSVLDVGAASGDTSARLGAVKVTGIDRVASHLHAFPGDKVAADAFTLPFADGSFDVVFCSLFLHHFSDEDVVKLLTEFSRIARAAVAVIDLERNYFAYQFVPMTSWLLRWDGVTRHDAPASVAAGFQKSELHALAHQAGLSNIAVKRHWPWFRLSLVAEAQTKTKD